MAEFDTVAKHLIQTHPADFARFALQRDDIEDVKVLDTEQPSVRRPDSLLRVCVGNDEVLVHHEFQTTDSTGTPMPQRMAGYIGRLIERYGLPVYAHVLYLRPNAGRRDPGYYLQEHSDYSVAIRYKVLRLSQLPGQAVLDSEVVGLLPFAPLMQPPAGQTEAMWLEQCVATAWDMPLERPVKADVLTGLTLLSGLVYNPQTITAIVSKEYLMDLMRESPFAQYLTQQAREEGIEQGIEQGERKHAIEALLEVVELRFGADAAESLAASIRAIDEVPRLNQLHRTAIQASSFEEFRTVFFG
ncbi:MAG: hypothetical protein F4Y91_02935 [Gemmatimonadetes bacterium]|nr:hypothetical protein [Gemmatimonadota bacterium]MYB70409.1 hypothetical protein [Gemmatimonadota bacterium]